MKRNANQVFIDDDLIERLLRGEKPNVTAPSEPEPESAPEPEPEPERDAPAVSGESEPSPEEASSTEALSTETSGAEAHRDNANPANANPANTTSEVAPVSGEVAAPEATGSAMHEALDAAASPETGEPAEQAEKAAEKTASGAESVDGLERVDGLESVDGEVPRVLYETAEPVSAITPPPAEDPGPQATALRELAESVSAEAFPAATAPRKRTSFAGLFAKAVSLASQGRLDDAIEVLEGSVADNEGAEDSADVHAGLGHLRFEQGNWAEAAQHYRETAKSEPGHPTAHYNLALALERQGKFQEAEEAFAAAVRADEGRWQARLGLGLCLLHPYKTEEPHADANPSPTAQSPVHRSEEALACLEAVEAGGHGSDVADVVVFGKAVALQQLGRLADALALYQALLPGHPEARDLINNLLLIAAARQDWGETEELAHRLIEIEPHSVAAMQALGAVEAARGNFTAAVEHGRTLTGTVPESYDAWFNLGLAQYALDDFGGARIAFEHALRIYEQGHSKKGAEAHAAPPYAAEAYANLGATLQALGELAAAGAAYARALELRPAMLGVLWNVGLLFAQQGDAREAERLFQRVAAIRPDWEDVAFRLGVLQFERADYASAANSFETFLGDHPDWTDPRVNLAICQWKLGQTEKAGETLAIVMEHDPEHKGALACLAALSLENVNEHDEAHARAAVVELYHKVAGLGLASPELSFNAGVLLQGAGDPAAALPCFEDAIARRPEFSTAMLNLGHVYQQLGDPEKANATWAQAILAEADFAAGYFN